MEGNTQDAVNYGRHGRCWDIGELGFQVMPLVQFEVLTTFGLGEMLDDFCTFEALRRSAASCLSPFFTV